jgi:signal transduction histidine kinase
VIGHPKAIRVTYNNGSASELVRGDPARLRQLFLILLDNAVRYSKSQGEVKVDMEKANGEVAVRLADHGIGIAPEELESVFDRFRRGTNVQHDGEGLGLGLPVAKAIAEAHKGRIEMASRLGEGTTVTVFLPADISEAEA